MEIEGNQIRWYGISIVIYLGKVSSHGSNTGEFYHKTDVISRLQNRFWKTQK